MEKSAYEISQAIEQSSNKELQTLITLSIGRILRMGSRPAQSGDGREFDKYAALAIAAKEELNERRCL